MPTRAPEVRYRTERVESISIVQPVKREEGIDGKVRFKTGKTVAKINGKRVSVDTAQTILTACLECGVMPRMETE